MALGWFLLMRHQLGRCHVNMWPLNVSIVNCALQLRIGIPWSALRWKIKTVECIRLRAVHIKPLQLGSKCAFEILTLAGDGNAHLAPCCHLETTFAELVNATINSKGVGHELFHRRCRERRVEFGQAGFSIRTVKGYSNT